MTDSVAVLGVGMTAFSGAGAGRGIRELALDAALGAAADADVNLDSVDLVVLAYESDHFAGQVSLGNILIDHLGIVGCPIVRVEGGGASGAVAIQTARLALLSGAHSRVLVLGCETNASGADRTTATEILAMSADVEWETPIFGTFAVPYALMMDAHMRRYGTTPDQFAQIAVKNRRLALDNPLAHKGMDIDTEAVLTSRPIADPYRMLDCSLLSDGAAAMILTRDAPASSSQRPVNLTAVGAATDHPRIADRAPENLPHFIAKRRAAAAAYRQAGIDDPATDIDVAEVYDSFSGAELQAYEDLGFCEIGDGGAAAETGRFDLDGVIAVNTSGGLLGRGSAVGATGIAQAIEVVHQLRGTATPSRQVAGARRGLTDTHAGAGALCVVQVYEAAA